MDLVAQSQNQNLLFGLTERDSHSYYYYSVEDQWNYGAVFTVKFSHLQDIAEAYLEPSQNFMMEYFYENS